MNIILATVFTIVFSLADFLLGRSPSVMINLILLFTMLNTFKLMSIERGNKK